MNNTSFHVTKVPDTSGVARPASSLRRVVPRLAAILCLLAGFSLGRAAEPANPAALEPGSIAKRKAILEGLQRRLPPTEPLEAFNDFLKREGELPPDFDLMPSQFFLPDPLSWVELGRGRRATPENWPERRQQLADQMERWVLGVAPPAPGNVVAEILEKTTIDGYEVWNVRLSFGPDHAAKLGVKLYLPKNRAPSGIFLCDSERYRSWVKKAMDGGGFGFAVHNARDGRGDESLKYSELFGKRDWSALRRRGWSASRALDWLVTLPFVDPHQVYIGGHSRSGKVALTAAAFDPRFAGVISSSSGTAGSIPYRFSDQYYSGASVERMSRQHPDWINLRARFFAGNEDKLPVDSHFLYALIAPRPLLTSTATEDAVESTWAVEQVHRSIEPVYEMFGRASNLVVRYRPGGHTIFGPETPAAYSDFLLNARSGAQPLSRLFPYRPFHPWDYQAWAARNPVDVAKFPRVNPQLSLQPPVAPVTPEIQASRHREVAQRIQWLIGDEIPYRKTPVVVRELATLPVAMRNHFTKIQDEVDGVPPPAPRRGPPDPDADESDPPARPLRQSSVTATVVTFGDNITGCLFVPGQDRHRPVVIWLAAFQPAQGYAPGRNMGEFAPVALLKAGYPVFAFDPIGTFFRQEERREFFVRHPNASLMGKMVCDARNAIDAATELLGTPRPVYLYGFAMGGTTALFTAGIDERVDGVAAAAAFTPLRTDVAGRRDGGLARLSQFYGWLPRLGAFIGHEDRVPVDYNEILASMAPRKVLIVAPTEDRYATLGEVRDTVAFARLTYASLGEEGGIEMATPFDENRLTDGIHREVIDWLGRQIPRHR